MFGVFSSRKLSKSLPVNHLGGLKCCLFGVLRPVLVRGLLALPGLRGDLGGFARELAGLN
jgi:hypothetical protein